MVLGSDQGTHNSMAVCWVRFDARCGYGHGYIYSYGCIYGYDRRYGDRPSATP